MLTPGQRNNGGIIFSVVLVVPYNTFYELSVEFRMGVGNAQCTWVLFMGITRVRTYYLLSSIWVQ